MLNRIIRRAARAMPAIALLAAWPFHARGDGGVDFTHLAPANPAFVLRIPDFARMHAAFDSSELGKLWREPGIRAFVEEMTSETNERVAEFLKELGAETKDLKAPTGDVGMAIYMPRSLGAGDDQRPPPAALIAADAGENAQSWKDLIDKLVDKGVKDKGLTTDEDTYAGVTITILRPVYQDARTAPGGAEEEEDGGPLEPPQTGFAGFIGGSKEHPQALHLAWSGTTLLGATRIKDLEHAIDAVQGKEGESLASDPDFKAAAAQHPSDTQAACYINLGQILSTSFEAALAARAGLDEGGPDLRKVMSVLGVDQVKFLSFGVRMDTAQAALETTMAVLAPEKRGLLKLMSEPLGAFDPPGFVPPDAASAMRLSFRFDGVFDLLRGVAAALPEDEARQFSAGLDQSVNLVKPGLDALGPAVDIVGTFRLPLAQDSQMTLVAIAVKDQETVANTLSFFASQAPGMAASREFEGNTIYTVDLANVSVGLGFHRLFIGPTAAVENAMRLSGRADAPRISGEDAFRDATRGFGSDGVMQSFSDTAQAMRWMYWTLQNADKIAEAQIDDSELEPAQKERILRGIRDGQPKWLQRLPSIDLVLRHLGDSASEMHPTPDGFRGKTLLLKPAPR